MTDRPRLDTVPTIQLLAELVRRHDPAPAPSKTRRFGPWSDFIIPIGHDHHASLAFDKEALEELHRIAERPVYVPDEPDPQGELDRAGPGGDGGDG